MKALTPPILFLVAALAACTLPPNLTPARVDDSVYMVTGDTKFGTAWVAAPGYLVTAGHVCEDNGPVLTAQPQDGWTVLARPVLFEVSAGPEGDVCVLKVDGPLSPPLPLAPDQPGAGTADWTVGFPGGTHTVSRGKVLGDTHTSDFSAPGSSGGPVATDDGVYMIVIGTLPDQDGVFGTPAPEIRRALRSAGAVLDPQPGD